MAEKENCHDEPSFNVPARRTALSSTRREIERPYRPQPNQLGPNGKNKAAWWDKFCEFWSDERRKLALSRMPAMAQYCRQFRRDLPAQAVFVSDLLGIGAKATSGAFTSFVERYLVRLDYLTLDDCRDMGVEQVSRAHSEALEGVERGWVEVESYSPPQ